MTSDEIDTAILGLAQDVSEARLTALAHAIGERLHAKAPLPTQAHELLWFLNALAPQRSRHLTRLLSPSLRVGRSAVMQIWAVPAGTVAIWSEQNVDWWPSESSDLPQLTHSDHLQVLDLDGDIIVVASLSQAMEEVTTHLVHLICHAAVLGVFRAPKYDDCPRDKAGLPSTPPSTEVPNDERWLFPRCVRCGSQQAERLTRRESTDEGDALISTCRDLASCIARQAL